MKKSDQPDKTNWDAMIRVYDKADKVIEPHEHTGEISRSSERIALKLHLLAA